MLQSDKRSGNKKQKKKKREYRQKLPPVTLNQTEICQDLQVWSDLDSLSRKEDLNKAETPNNRKNTR